MFLIYFFFIRIKKIEHRTGAGSPRTPRRVIVSLLNRFHRISCESYDFFCYHHSSNNLDALPEWIPELPFLRALFASHNDLIALPDRLFSHPSRLEVLHLDHNRLQALPPPRRALNLVHLTLQGNALTALPSGFFTNTQKYG